MSSKNKRMEEARLHMLKRGYAQCDYCEIWMQAGSRAWEWHTSGMCMETQSDSPNDWIERFKRSLNESVAAAARRTLPPRNPRELISQEEFD